MKNNKCIAPLTIYLHMSFFFTNFENIIINILYYTNKLYSTTKKTKKKHVRASARNRFKACKGVSPQPFVSSIHYHTSQFIYQLLT